MIILSHRGYWLEAAEKNTLAAFNRSFELGFGTETDVRDLCGKLVVSHDMPQGQEMLWADFVKLLAGKNLPLAVNVKSDGLAVPIKELMAGQEVNWFVFDMSVPDMRSHFQVGNPVFARMSEVEREPAWFAQVVGIWLDAFGGAWYDAATIVGLLEAGKQVCVVSPELHGRPYKEVWQTLLPLAGRPGLMLCTDVPEQARSFFGVGE